MSKLFVAIATGQNVANLPPIINIGIKGDDVLWIVSETALQQNWLNGSNRVLQKRGFTILESLTISNELMVQPFKLMEIFLNTVYRMSLNNKEIVFVMTGGQKTAVMGIVLALLQRDLNFKLVYQDIKPVKLWVTNKKKLNFEPLDINEALSLEELLEVYNFSKKDNTYKEPIQLFPEFDLNLSEEEKIAYQQYIENSEISFLLFQIFSKFSKNKNNLKMNFPLPQHLYEQFQIQIRHWFHKSFYNIIYPFNKLKKNITDVEYLKKNMGTLKNEEREKKIFFLMYKLFRDLLSRYQDDQLYFKIEPYMANLLREAGWIDEKCNNNIRKNNLRRRIGEFFEKMVAFRLIQFIKNDQAIQNIISEIWLNYPVRRKDDEYREFMEGDIFIVLKNATIIYLECKTFKISEQDIFSKLERFRQVSGFVNKSYVVIPIFSVWPAESHEYADVFNLLENLNRVGIEYIPFTGIQHSNVMNLKERRLEVPTFEEKLSKIFKPFIA